MITVAAGRRAWPWWAVSCLVAATACGTWWLSSVGLYHGPDHAVGPYAIPLSVEYAVGMAAVASGVFAVFAWAAGRAHGSGLSSGALLLILATAGYLTLTWRFFTSGVDGANIGAGLMAMAGPFVTGGLLHAAVAAERRSRGGAMANYALFVALAWTFGSLLFSLV